MDARAKIICLLAYTIGIFFVDNWWALATFALAAFAVLAAARIRPRDVHRLLVPVYVLAGFSALFNFIASPGWEGASMGLFFAVRMIALVAASFAVCLTTPPTDLVNTFAWFISPLRRLKAPVDDIAFTLGLALRFIPLVEREFSQIRIAQAARGGLQTGSARRDLRNWANAFGVLFVVLFRHADTIADAMDARCYGASPARTRLGP